MARTDPHSFNDSEQPESEHLTWRARVDFDARVLEAEATLRFKSPGEGPLDLDTRGLQVDEVRDLEGRALPFELGAPDDVLGERLRVQLPPGTPAVTLRYRTSPGALALQW